MASPRKLLDDALAWLRGERHTARVRRCVGMTFDEVQAAVESAVAEEDLPILQEVIDQAEAYEALPARRLPDGTQPERLSGWREWLDLLAAGHASLPERMPTSALLAWRNAGRRDPAANVLPQCRCADCRMVVPAHDESGNHGWPIRPCPACGSTKPYDWASLWEGGWGQFALKGSSAHA